MTLLPMPTVIVIGLDAADGPPRKPAQQVAVPINLAERSRFSLLHRRPSSSPDAVLNRRRHRRTNGANCSLPPSQPAPRSRPRRSHYPHSAQPSAASFNPASVRSRSRQHPCLRCDLTEPSRFQITCKMIQGGKRRVVCHGPGDCGADGLYEPARFGGLRSG